MNEEVRLEVPAPETEPARHRNSIFFGEQGLRAGWSALLFLALVAVLGAATAWVMHLLLHNQFGHRGPTSPWAMLTGEGVQLGVVLLATWIMSRIEQRPFTVYGYAGRARLPRFLWGCMWGFLAISALVGTLWKEHLLAFDAGRLHGTPMIEYGLTWLAVFIGVGLFEESLLLGDRISGYMVLPASAAVRERRTRVSRQNAVQVDGVLHEAAD